MQDVLSKRKMWDLKRRASDDSNAGSESESSISISEPDCDTSSQQSHGSADSNREQSVIARGSGGDAREPGLHCRKEDGSEGVSTLNNVLEFGDMARIHGLSSDKGQRIERPLWQTTVF